MRKSLVALMFLAASTSFADPPQGTDGVGFKGIYRGQAVSSLPSTITKDGYRIDYRGDHAGDFFVVNVTGENSVVYFDVSYVAKRRTLAEALAEHSFSRAPRVRLAYPDTRYGKPQHVLDLDHGIWYETKDGSAAPDAIVSKVTYLMIGAPVLNSHRGLLSEADVLALFEAGKHLKFNPMEIPLDSKDQQSVSATNEKSGDWRSTCDAQARHAEAAMTARQSGVSMADTMLHVDVAIAKLALVDHPDAHRAGKALKEITISAYDEPRYSTKEGQRRSVEEFRDRIYMDCVKRLRPK
jgi:hypothetical protein